MKLRPLSRRRLLRTMALLALMPEISLTEATAWSHGAPGGGFNGGKSQVNLNFNQIGGDYPFADFWLDAACWSARDNWGPVPPDQLSTTGWPLPNTDIMNNHLGCGGQFFVPSILNGGSVYAIPVTGKGTVETFGSVVTIPIVSVTGGSTTATINFGVSHYFEAGMECPLSGISGTIAVTLNGNKYVVASVTTQTITITVSSTTGLSGTGGTAAYGDFNVGVATGAQVIVDITGTSPNGPGNATGNAIQINLNIRATDATTPISKMSYVSITERARWHADPWAFGSKFLSKLKSWNPGAIRFLNKTGTNGSNEAVWADSKSKFYTSMACNTFNPAIWCGTSTSALNAYAITLGSGAPIDKQHFTLSYDSVAVTCSVSGTAAVLTFPSAHNIAVGDTFNIFVPFGGVAPTDAATGQALLIRGAGLAANSTNSTDFYALTTPTSSTLTFSFSPGGSPVTTSAAGSLLRAHVGLAQNTFVTTVSSATMTCAGHNFKVGMLISPTIFQNGSVYPTGISPLAKTYFVKTTTSSTITISATLGGAAIVMDQAQSIVYREQATLAVNGGTAYPIKDLGGSSMSYGQNSIIYPYIVTSKAFGTITFDAELQCWLNLGASTGGGNSVGIANGWPPELCLKLCNEVGSQPQFTMPPLALDPPTDYAPNLGTLAKNNVTSTSSWMIPAFQGVNEFWNFGFFGTVWGSCKALAHSGWTNANFTDEDGLQTSCLGQAINTAFGGGAVGVGYDIICGIQTASALGTSTAGNNDQRMKSTQYVASGPTFAGYTKTAASNWVTVGVCAQYFSPTLYGSTQETTWANLVASFTASINTSGVMNVTATAAGTIAVGMIVSGGSVPWQSTITSNLGGGNWQLNVSPAAAVASNQMYGADPANVKAYVDSCTGNRFTGAILSAGVLTVSALGDSWTTIVKGDLFAATGLADNATIGTQISGTTGGVGTYNISTTTTSLSARSMVSGNFVPAILAMAYRNMAAWLLTFTSNAGNHPKMRGYEGGYSPDLLDGGNSRRDQFRAFSKLVTSSTIKVNGLQDFYTDNVDNFVSAGGTFWSEFQFTGASSVVDAWSVLDDLYMAPAGPQEAAIALRN